MRLLELIRGIARKPERTASNYDPVASHPGLLIPAPDPSSPFRKKRGRFRASGEIVADYDVLAAYPEAITRDYRFFDWSKDDSDQDQRAAVFEVAGGLVTRGYLTIDPTRGYLFANHSYDSLSLVAGWKLATRQTFEFSAMCAHELWGKVVVIGGPFESNYFHGLFNWFARLVMLDQMAPHIRADKSILYLIDRRAQSEPFRSIIAALGMGADRIIWSDPEIDYRIENAVFVSFFHEGLLCPELIKLTAIKIRGALGINEGMLGRRRIWISREHFADARRRISNIEEIAPLLDQHGLERLTLENLSFDEQVAMFSDAEIVAG